MNRAQINKFLDSAKEETKKIGRQLYLEGCVQKVFEIKPNVYRVLVVHQAREMKITVSFLNVDMVVNCECLTFRMEGVCPHIIAALYYLVEHPVLPESIFNATSVDSLVYDCDEKTAKDYLTYSLAHSENKREFIKFLFFRLQDMDLKEADYQYIFDYLYTLSTSSDRVKIINRLYESLFERFKAKLLTGNYKEALLIVKQMINNESNIEKDVVNSLAYFEEHFSKNVMQIKSCLKYLSIYVEEFSEAEEYEYRQVLVSIMSKPKVYVACCTEIKHLVFEHFTGTDAQICQGLKDMFLLLARCSDVTRQTTIELTFKLIDPKDDDYPFFKAIYSQLLFNRAYNPSNLNLDLLEEIKQLNEDSYASDINKLARFINEKHSQKQLLDVYANEENWYNYGLACMEYPSLRDMYLYSANIKAALGNEWTGKVFAALCQYVLKFPSGLDSAFIPYIYMSEGEEYFMLLMEMIIDNIQFDRARDLIERYRDVKYRAIARSLPANVSFESYYQQNFKNK